jgi:hypothetical protein
VPFEEQVIRSGAAVAVWLQNLVYVAMVLQGPTFE